MMSLLAFVVTHTVIVSLYDRVLSEIRHHRCYIVKQAGAAVLPQHKAKGIEILRKKLAQALAVTRKGCRDSCSVLHRWRVSSCTRSILYNTLTTKPLDKKPSSYISTP